MPGERGPLYGIRVVDVTDTFMGPYASLLLAQMGAEVVKVELPIGDVTRQIGDVTGDGFGPMFLNLNQGKKSVVLDLRQPGGYRRLLSLVEHSDVLLHNRRPRAAARMRIDYPTLRAVNPRLVHCAAVGFGSTGPYADRAAYDDVIQAASGFATVQTGNGDPAYVRTPVADKIAGLLAFGAISAALFERERSGQGQAIEVPMFETTVSFLLVEQQGGFVHEPARGPTGYPRTDSLYRRPYRTSDGLIGVLVYTDDQWRRFFELVGSPGLASDPRYATMRARSQNIDSLYAFVEARLAERTSAQWLESLNAQGIPASAVNSVEDLFTDEHLTATGFFESVVHPVVGPLRRSRVPVSFSRTRPAPLGPAPRLGEHDGWLSELADSDAASGPGIAEPDG